MRFGVREICDVVLRAKAMQRIGNKVFYKDEPVLYFDSLKTSSLEGAATTVYAQGGRGNSRLIAWEGERTVTFTMEDALISPAGFSILSGAGLISADDENNKLKVHHTERTANIEYLKAGIDEYVDAITYEVLTADDYIVKPDEDKHYVREINGKKVLSHPKRLGQGTVEDPYYWAENESISYEEKVPYWEVQKEMATADQDMLFIYVQNKPYNPTGESSNPYAENYIYIMRVANDEIVTEPFIPIKGNDHGNGNIVEDFDSPFYGQYKLILTDDDNGHYVPAIEEGFMNQIYEDGEPTGKYEFDTSSVAFVDYYTEVSSGVQRIDITPDKFGGNYYLEASTLFRDTNGVDLPAEFIIPNCKIQSNFTFSMASSGDPSTFTFTMDAFPDYTRFDSTKKVLASIQIIDSITEDAKRAATKGSWSKTESQDAVRERTWTEFEPND